MPSRHRSDNRRWVLFRINEIVININPIRVRESKDNIRIEN